MSPYNVHKPVLQGLPGISINKSWGESLDMKPTEGFEACTIHSLIK